MGRETRFIRLLCLVMINLLINRVSEVASRIVNLPFEVVVLNPLFSLLILFYEGTADVQITEANRRVIVILGLMHGPRNRVFNPNTRA